MMLLVLGISIVGYCPKSEAAAFSSFSELEDKRIGVATGSVQALQTEERFPNADLYYFSTSVDMLNSIYDLCLMDDHFKDCVSVFESKE